MASQRNVVELVLQLKDELSKNAGKMSKSMLRLQKGFQVLAKASLAAGAAIAAFGASLFAIAKSTAAFADELGKAAQATGITVEACQLLPRRRDHVLGPVDPDDFDAGLGDRYEDAPCAACKLHHGRAGLGRLLDVKLHVAV